MGALKCELIAQLSISLVKMEVSCEGGREGRLAQKAESQDEKATRLEGDLGVLSLFVPKFLNAAVPQFPPLPDGEDGNFYLLKKATISVAYPPLCLPTPLSLPFSSSSKYECPLTKTRACTCSAWRT